MIYFLAPLRSEYNSVLLGNLFVPQHTLLRFLLSSFFANSNSLDEKIS